MYVELSAVWFLSDKLGFLFKLFITYNKCLYLMTDTKISEAKPEENKAKNYQLYLWRQSQQMRY